MRRNAVGHFTQDVAHPHLVTSLDLLPMGRLLQVACRQASGVCLSTKYPALVMHAQNK
jgi:hypothetical protein